MTISNLGKKEFISPIVPSNSASSKARAGDQARQEPGGGADAGAVDGHCLPACSAWFAQPAL